MPLTGAFVGGLQAGVASPPTGGAGVPAFAAESNREDLLDFVLNLDKMKKAAVFVAAPKTIANGLNHEWLTDTLPATNTAGSIEGADWSSSAIDARVRINNAVQTFASGLSVSMDQVEYSRKGQTPGVANEYEYQVERFLLAIEQSMDARAVALGTGVSVNSASASNATARFRAIRGWHATVSAATGAVTTAAVASAGSGVSRINASGAWRNSDFLLLHESMYLLGGDPDTLAVDQGVAMDIADAVLGSTGATSVLRQVYTKDNDSEFARDVQFMRTPFGRVAVLIDRFIPQAAIVTDAISGGAAFVYERARLRFAFWRPMRHYPLPPTGDSVKGYVHAGVTLEPLHPQTIGVIYNLST